MGLGFLSRLFRDTGLRSPRSFVPSDDGAIGVEFAMILPVLMLFILGIITFGWVFYLQNNMETAAREAARRMAVAEAPFAGTDVTCADPIASVPGNAETIACSILPDYGNLIIVNATDGCLIGDRSMRVEIRMNGSDVAILDIFGFFVGTVLRAEAFFRKEAEC